MSTATLPPPVFINGRWFYARPQKEDTNNLFYPPEPEPTPVVAAPKRPGFFRRAWTWTKNAAKNVGGWLGIGAVVGVVVVAAASVATAVATAAAYVWNWAWPLASGAAVWVWGVAVRIPAAARFVVMIPVWGFWIAVALGMLAGEAIRYFWSRRQANKKREALQGVYDVPQKSSQQEPQQEPAKEPAKEPENDTVQGTVVPNIPEPETVVEWTKVDSKGKEIKQTMTVRTMDIINKGDVRSNVSPFDMRKLLVVDDEQELTDHLLGADKGQALYDHIRDHILQRSEQITAFWSILEFMKYGDAFTPQEESRWFGRLDALAQFDTRPGLFFNTEETPDSPVITEDQWVATQKQRWATLKKNGHKDYAFFRQPEFTAGFREEYRHLAEKYADPRVTANN